MYIKKRRLVFNIIALVWVNDYVDDYMQALVDIYNKIKQSITGETTKIGLLKYIWDLIGISEEIDAESIYRIYLRVMYPHSLIIHTYPDTPI